MMSGTHYQQCYLLMAWSVVDPADLADGEPMTRLLGEPAAVAAWCRRQRPAGLTAEPDTPRGRAELLLRPELLLRALGEAVPREMDWWRGRDRELKEAWEGNYRPPATYQQRRERLELLLSCDLQHRLRLKLPEMDGPTVVATAGLWRRRMQQLLTGDRLRAAYDAAVGRWPDRWQLLQHYLAEDDEQDSPQGDRDGEIEDEEQHCDEEERPSDGPHRPSQGRCQQLELRGAAHSRSGLNKKHTEERRQQEQEHGEEWQELDERHYEERIELHQQHRSAITTITSTITITSTPTSTTGSGIKPATSLRECLIIECILTETSTTITITITTHQHHHQHHRLRDHVLHQPPSVITTVPSITITITSTIHQHHRLRDQARHQPPPSTTSTTSTTGLSTKSTTSRFPASIGSTATSTAGLRTKPTISGPAAHSPVTASEASRDSC
ncbi:hypothetical protein FJT64_012931 [Amphibalanus amphitrite]|uniref:Uncharacterized protein n=1 Tax=Amphibalanus amphitrite TaxID=1232801 RepID=A0A6A4V4W9_AMPAM|nr:hypothetical protein FJT64_012931 [Amphibalanus amphitrite]